MCDYSLGGIPNRLAVEGEELIVHRFPTHSVGLASPTDLQPKIIEVPLQRDRSIWSAIKNFFAPSLDCGGAPAVCIPPGASLILKNIPVDLQRKWSIAEEENVVFVQTSAEVNTYRDAVSFRNGRRVLLQNLAEGMHVKVASLGGDSIFEREPVMSVPSGRPFA